MSRPQYHIRDHTKVTAQGEYAWCGCGAMWKYDSRTGDSWSSVRLSDAVFDFMREISKTPQSIPEHVRFALNALDKRTDSLVWQTGKPEECGWYWIRVIGDYNYVTITEIFDVCGSRFVRHDPKLGYMTRLETCSIVACAGSIPTPHD